MPVRLVVRNEGPVWIEVSGDKAVVEVNVGTRRVGFEFLALCRPPETGAMPLTRVLAVRTGPSTTTLAPTQPTTRPIGGRTEAEFGAVVVTVTFRLVTFLSLRGEGPVPGGADGPEVLVTECVSVAPFLGARSGFFSVTVSRCLEVTRWLRSG